MVVIIYGSYFYPSYFVCRLLLLLVFVFSGNVFSIPGPSVCVTRLNVAVLVVVLCYWWNVMMTEMTITALHTGAAAWWISGGTPWTVWNVAVSAAAFMHIGTLTQLGCLRRHYGEMKQSLIKTSQCGFGPDLPFHTHDALFCFCHHGLACFVVPLTKWNMKHHSHLNAISAPYKKSALATCAQK